MPRMLRVRLRLTNRMTRPMTTRATAAMTIRRSVRLLTRAHTSLMGKEMARKKPVPVGAKNALVSLPP